MIARQALPAPRIVRDSQPVAKNDDGLVSEARVKLLLRELAVALHATRAVGWRGGIAPKKG